VCYTAVALEEVQEDCGEEDPGCKKRYKVGNKDFSMPLIDIQQHGRFKLLTKHISVWDWQSQEEEGEGPRYMRAGTTVLEAIEALMAAYKATIHNLRPAGAGYRTMARNLTIRGASETSHHTDGVAADVTLAGAPTQVKKCQVLITADYFIAGRGEVLAEKPRNVNGILIPKTSVHISIPGKPGIDYADYPDQWRCP
jgi:hypothetical protein